MEKKPIGLTFVRWAVLVVMPIAYELFMLAGSVVGVLQTSQDWPFSRGPTSPPRQACTDKQTAIASMSLLSQWLHFQR